MKRRILMLGAIILLAGAGRAFAHHSFAAEYDSTQKVEVEGVVTEFVWRNPHSFMKIDVAAKDGTTQSWALEWGSVSQLAREGQMTRTTLKPGDHVVVNGQPARDAAAHRMLIGSIKRPSDGWEWKGRVQ
jgi:hypothetical protein